MENVGSKGTALPRLEPESVERSASRRRYSPPPPTEDVPAWRRVIDSIQKRFGRTPTPDPPQLVIVKDDRRTAPRNRTAMVTPLRRKTDFEPDIHEQPTFKRTATNVVLKLLKKEPLPPPEPKRGPDELRLRAIATSNDTAIHIVEGQNQTRVTFEGGARFVNEKRIMPDILFGIAYRSEVRDVREAACTTFLAFLREHPKIAIGPGATPRIIDIII